MISAWRNDPRKGAEPLLAHRVGGAATRKLLCSLASWEVAWQRCWLAFVCACSLGGSLAAWETVVGPSNLEEPAASKANAKPRKERMDFHGDSLPEGALLRLGTVRFRHVQGIESLTYVQDGKVLAIGGFHDGEVRSWEVATGKELWRDGGGASLAYAPGNKTLAGTWRDKVRLWDPASGKLLWQKDVPLRAYGSELWNLQVACTPDGQILAMGTFGLPPLLQLWDVASNKLHWEKRIITPDIAISPDGKLLATGISSGSAVDVYVMWDIASGKQLWRASLAKESENGFCSKGGLAFSPDSKILATEGYVGFPYLTTVTLRDAATGKKILNLKSAKNSCADMPVAFSPDGKTIACVGHDGADRETKSRVQLYDVASGKMLWESEDRIERVWKRGLAFSPDGKTLVSGSKHRGVVHFWDAATGKELTRSVELLQARGHEHSVCAVVYTADGKNVLTAGLDRTARRWDAASGRQLTRARISNRGQDGGQRPRIVAMVVPDGKMAAASGGKVLTAASSDEDLQVWDFAASKLLWRTNIRVFALAFSPSGKTLAAGTNDGVVRLWDAASGKQLWVWKPGAPERIANSLAFSPDGRTLAVSYDGLMLLEAATGEKLRQLWQPESPNFLPKTLAYSPDGRILAMRRDSKEVWLWEVASGQKISQLSLLKKEKDNDIQALTFRPDSRMLALGGDGGWIRIWDVAAGREVRYLKGPQGEILSLAFSPDGRTLVSGGKDGTALIWDSSIPATPARPRAKGLDDK
jgi:WD40 repeat protein